MISRGLRSPHDTPINMRVITIIFRTIFCFYLTLHHTLDEHSNRSDVCHSYVHHTQTMGSASLAIFMIYTPSRIYSMGSQFHGLDFPRVASFHLEPNHVDPFKANITSRSTGVIGIFATFDSNGLY
jgi:hypothetical protein